MGLNSQQYMYDNNASIPMEIDEPAACEARCSQSADIVDMEIDTVDQIQAFYASTSNANAIDPLDAKELSVCIRNASTVVCNAKDCMQPVCSKQTFRHVNKKLHLCEQHADLFQMLNNQKVQTLHGTKGRASPDSIQNMLFLMSKIIRWLGDQSDDDLIQYRHDLQQDIEIRKAQQDMLQDEYQDYGHHIRICVEEAVLHTIETMS